METIIVGKPKGKKNIDYKILILVMVIFFSILIFSDIGLAAFGLLSVFFPMIIGFFYSLHFKILDVNSSTSIMVNESELKYFNSERGIDLLEIKLHDISKMKISYKKRWFRLFPVYDLRFDFLTKQNTLYTLYSEGIISKKGDYKKVVDYLESKNIEVYDPYNIRSLLVLDYNDIQLQLRQREWDDEKQ